MTEPIKYAGPAGYAEELTINTALPGASTTVCWWLLTGPWHPLWSQFVLCVVSLADIEGAPPAILAFPGATHELMVVALDPGEPPTVHKPEVLASGGFAAVGGFLTPVDVVHQFTATDDEMREVARLAAKMCAFGKMNPSTDDARERLREWWLSACVKTLAHMRGEVHAR